MSVRLSKIQRQLCNALQQGLAISSRPFADLAQSVDTDEETVLHGIGQLKKMGIVRRISAIVNHRALGLVGTLVTAHIRQECLRDVAEVVNSLEGVSHNYLREHYYNLWFTLQADSREQIKEALSNLSKRFSVDFHSMPVERVFKLDVRFDAEKTGRPVLRDIEEIAKSETVELEENEKRILSRLQNDLELTAKPFDFLCGEGLQERDFLRIISGLIDKGVIRRIAGVVDYRRLGFVANVLFCCEVGEDRIVRAGKELARFGIVSHCYQRKTFEGWRYNLFAMMHGRSMGEIQQVVNEFVEGEEIESFELLPTTAELKKQPIRYVFGES